MSASVAPEPCAPVEAGTGAARIPPSAAAVVEPGWRSPQGVAERRGVPTLLRSLARSRRDPLIRNGHALIAGSVATAVIGVVFWIVAAHRYAPEFVGRNSVVISTFTFIGAISQLNLVIALTRFVPAAGDRSRRLVVGAYAISAAIAGTLAVVFLLIVTRIEPRLGFLVQNRWLAFTFVGVTALWTIFVMQDGVLAGLRRANVVPVENAGFALVKVALLLPLAGLVPNAGIFLAWSIATLATVIPTNGYIFGRALPHHERHSVGAADFSLAQLRQFVTYDYIGSLFWFGAASLLPLVVLRRAGGAASAYFSLAWMIAYALYTVSLNIGSSLVVETAADQSGLDAACRRMMTHLAKIVVPAVVLIVVIAPELLRLFGAAYEHAGTVALRLLVLSAIPYIVVGTAESAYRARRRTRPLVALNGALFVISMPLSWVLLPSFGVTGVALAWLIAEVVVTTGLILARRTWLGPGS